MKTMTREEFEDDIAELIDEALANGFSKDIIIATLQHLIHEINNGVFDPPT